MNSLFGMKQGGTGCHGGWVQGEEERFMFQNSASEFKAKLLRIKGSG